MAEYIYTDTQTVNENSNVVFSDSIVDGCDLVIHRNDSGIIKLFPIKGRYYTRYKVAFSGNLAVPSSGTAGAISVAIAIDGEPTTATAAIVTPTVVGAFFNVALTSYIYVRQGCCATLGIQNISSQTIEVANANIVVTRE